jgi:hypothetical protein
VLIVVQPKKTHQQVPLPAADDPDQQQGSEDFDVSDEDVEFVQQYGQQLGFLQQLNPQELDRCAGHMLAVKSAAARLQLGLSIQLQQNELQQNSNRAEV